MMLDVSSFLILDVYHLALFLIPVEVDILHRSFSFLQHSVQLALEGSKVIDIPEIGDFNVYRLG